MNAILHTDFDVEHHKGLLVTKLTVTLTSRTNVLKPKIWPYFRRYLKHRLHTWYQSSTSQYASNDPGYCDLDRIGK